MMVSARQWIFVIITLHYSSLAIMFGKFDDNPDISLTTVSSFNLLLFSPTCLMCVLTLLSISMFVLPRN